MSDVLHRIAVISLLICGLSAVGMALGGTWMAPPGGDGWASIVNHRNFMVLVLGASLVLAAVLPALRMPSIAMALLTKFAFLALNWGAADSAFWLEAGTGLALLAAGGIFLREAWQDARWHGVLPSRPGAWS
jgi:hypothetical protein